MLNKFALDKLWRESWGRIIKKSTKVKQIIIRIDGVQRSKTINYNGGILKESLEYRGTTIEVEINDAII